MVNKLNFIWSNRRRRKVLWRTFSEIGLVHCAVDVSQRGPRRWVGSQWLCEDCECRWTKIKMYSEGLTSDYQIDYKLPVHRRRRLSEIPATFIFASERVTVSRAQSQCASPQFIIQIKDYHRERQSNYLQAKSLNEPADL